MNLLIHKLPIQVKEMKINTDFRISILFELLMQNQKMRKELKIMKALQLYYPDFEKISNYEIAIEQMLWFYKCGKELDNSNKRNTNHNRYNQIYSYEFDDTYIYSAFLQQYHIDLQEVEYMHWWKFKAMFDGLSEDTEILKKVIKFVTRKKENKNLEIVSHDELDTSDLLDLYDVFLDKLTQTSHTNKVC